MRKKLVSLITTGVIVAQLLVPALGSAEEVVAKVTQEQAVAVVEKAFGASQKKSDLEIVLRNDDFAERTIWEFNWNYSRYGKYNSVHAQVDATSGEILGYDEFKEPQVANGAKPKTKEECAKIAQAYVQKLAPNYWQQTELTDSTAWYYGEIGAQSFAYVRKVNDISFPEDSIMLSIDGLTGTVQHYRINWHPEVKFPAVDKLIGEAEAAKVIRETTDLQLNYGDNGGYYNRILLGDPGVVKLYYNMNSAMMIDATTGKPLDYNGEEPQVQKQVYIEPKPELQIPLGSGKVLTLQEIESKVAEAVQIPAGYKLISRRQSERGESTLNKAWSFQYGPNGGYGPDSFDVTFDGYTGELLSMRHWVDGDPWMMPEEQKPVYTYEQCRKMAQDFVEKAAPTKVDYVLLQPDREPKVYYMNNIASQPRVYMLRFVRVVNGILFMNNSIDLEVDNLKGRITNYSVNWNNKLKFQSSEGIITKAEALDKLLDNPKVKPYYVRVGEVGDNNRQVKIMYSLDEVGQRMIEAKTGKVVNAFQLGPQGNYLDVVGHWAQREISILSMSGILKGSGDKFYPDKTMTRAEFVSMIVAAKGLEPLTKNVKNFTDVVSKDWYYGAIQAAVQEGLVQGNGDKFFPNQPISRQEMVVMMMMTVPQERLPEDATIPATYKDGAKVAPWAKTAMGQAIEMEIITGQKGLLKPTQAASRAEAAVMLMRLLEQSQRIN